MQVYQFNTVEGDTLYTTYTPKQVNELGLFDAMDDDAP